jgi:DNA-binding beta-propeller fold protein YncE
LEKKYENQLVVIGVHTAKFENEKDPDSILKAMARYEIDHPVVNDAKQAIWNAYGVQSWPTMFLIDPEGNAVGKIADEHVYETLDNAIGKLVSMHRKRGTLSERKIHFQAAKGVEHGDGPLFFPGKVVADDIGDRLFIADSTHHRLVVTTLAGKKVDIIGTGTAGKTDGPYDKASFNDPQGMALDGSTLYVADRRNHLIRAVDLKAKTVKTVAGTGIQSQDRQRGGPALRTGMNSPWDVLVHDKTLYIAEAGNHQIWTLDLATKRLMPYAGNGYEDIKDGPLLQACFAQPSGLATDGTMLYVADSEVSAIRALPLVGHSGLVKTIVGRGLFEFGDQDGIGPQVRLQHALGVVCFDNKLLIADTYNSKLKIIDPNTLACVSAVGGKTLQGEQVLNEPGGLTIAYGKVYVADTNAHRIRVVDIKTRAVATLELEGVQAPKKLHHVEDKGSKK